MTPATHLADLIPTHLCFWKSKRFQMISRALPRDRGSSGGGMCNSISPRVLHQREADRSISLRHPGCAHGRGACTQDIGSTSLAPLVWIKVSLTKGLLGINKPRNLGTINTEQFPLKYPEQSLSTASCWMNELPQQSRMGLFMTSQPRSSQCLWARAMCYGHHLPLKLNASLPLPRGET